LGTPSTVCRKAERKDQLGRIFARMELVKVTMNYGGRGNPLDDRPFSERIESPQDTGKELRIKSLVEGGPKEMDLKLRWNNP